MNPDEVHELMTLLCARAVDYELAETEDGNNFFFVTEDSRVPLRGGTHDSIVRSAQGRAGYHSFIGVHELSSGKNEPSTFGFLICPFSIKNDPNFYKSLGHLVAKSDRGKKDVPVKIIGRSSYSKALESGHTRRELFDNTDKLSGNNWKEIDLTMNIVSAAYQEVCDLPKWMPEYGSRLCPYCRSESDYAA
jgi:hypothetical protein